MLPFRQFDIALIESWKGTKHIEGGCNMLGETFWRKFIDFAFCFLFFINNPPKSLLDIGSGGSFFPSLVSNNFSSKCISLDVKRKGFTDSQKIISKSGDFLNFPVISNAKHLPFKEQSFDYVTALSSMEHFSYSEVEGFLKGAFWVLKEQGAALIIDVPIRNKPSVVSTDYGLISEFSKEMLNGLFRSAGFKSFRLFRFDSNISTFFCKELFLEYNQYQEVNKSEPLWVNHPLLLLFSDGFSEVLPKTIGGENVFVILEKD